MARYARENGGRARNMQKEQGLKFGYYYNYCSDISVQFQNAANSRYQFIVTPIVNPRGKSFEPVCDLVLSSTDWGKRVVCKIVTNDGDSTKICSKRIESQLNYAAHLGLPVILFESPLQVDDITFLSRIINAKVVASAGVHMAQIWIEIPVVSAVLQSLSHRNDLDDEKVKDVADEGPACYSDSWNQWNLFRSLITLDKRVGVALVLTAELPDTEDQERWAGEPVKALIIPTSTFLTNKKMFPVLSKSHQNFVKLLIEKTAREIQFIIRGPNLHHDIMNYHQYIDHLKNNHTDEDAVSRFARGYEDYLQIPLQPLMDNLESCTYEIFEKDPIKYSEYEKAIEAALGTLGNLKDIVVMVVGAGRGPLVNASIEAAKILNKKITIFAVEKNPNAVITLKYLQQHKWGGDKGTDFASVHVIDSDMRDWVSPKKADIVVSELLGSFGDNELSPECLDGVWPCVKENAISIPQSYTSYLAPIQSQKIFAETAMLREKDKPAFSPFEWSYVVHLKNCYVIEAAKPLFTFEHKDLHRPTSVRDNSRYKSLQFTAHVDCVCHGFAGYFEATLFGNIKLGTVPMNHTPGMFSWFPIFFPLNNPVQVKSNEILKVHFWRLISKRAVWYEWCLTTPQVTGIHNPNGRSHNIGLL